MKPNIVLVMCDQLRYDRLGVMGDPIIQTPNIDALSREGLIFENAYCPSPVCTPSRASVKTGLFPPGNGMVNNWVPFKEQVADSTDIREYLLPERLRALGYNTGMAGKLHFVPAEDNFGFDFKSLNDAPYSIYANDDKNSAYIKWLRENHFKDEDIVKIFDKDESYFPDNIYDFIMGSGWRTEEQHDIPWTIQESINFVDNRDQTKPFFLFTSIFGPHQPYLAPSPWDTLYKTDDIRLGPRFHAEMSNSPIFQMGPGKLAKRLRSEWSDDKYKEAIAAYYGQISMIDHYLGKMFEQLKEKGLWENSWIIFLADHGDFNAAYGTFFKGDMYDVSAKIPLIIKPAGGQAIEGIKDELVNSIDVYGTILDIAGDKEWKKLPHMESKSLLPLFSETTKSEWENRVFSIIGSDPEQNLCMLREGSMKIIRKSVKSGDPIYELYDYDKDPIETVNVYGRSS
ncbi:MAG: sulfatase-like hydrolase/transferase, partial [Spirochaetales bacterium]|nr:sulfatase-like hydrolase/transferase [Spirochaetales bacterium]